jgi:hypothetical protein
MTIIKDAVFLTADKLFSNQQAAWNKQRDYVRQHSTFYTQLWEGKTPPSDLCDLHELPLSDKTPDKEIPGTAPALRQLSRIRT